MNNFVSYTPTKVLFGKGTENNVGELVKQFAGTRAFLVYGGKSAERSGLIDRVARSLEEAGIAYQAFGGAKPNPSLEHAREGIRQAVSFGADFILGIGGGSAIDTAKAVAHGVAAEGTDIWDIWMGKCPLVCSLPVGAVVTIPAAGSEMSDSAVLTNEETGQKRGINTEFNRCRFAILNPELAMTLPRVQIANGVTDIMMHTMERYFIPDIPCELTDEIAEGLLRTVIRNGKIVLENPEDYDAMAEIVWSSSISHNDLTGLGRPKDFSVHALGQALGGRFDFTHGATLSAVWRAWAEYLYQETGALPRFAKYARKVWGVSEEDDRRAAEEGIRETVEFFHSLGMPVTIRELGAELSDEDCEALAEDATRGDVRKLTQIRPLGQKETAEIFRNAR